jgi:hypothetical protein
MSQDGLKGSCLCGGVTFEIRPPLTAFRYCHCSRCQKATGSAHAANIFLPEKQFKWLSGESLIKNFDLPGAERFSVSFCSQCGTRVPHKIRGREDYLSPAGVLDGDPGMRPDASIFWGSKAPWFTETHDIPKRHEYT